ncbi:MAG: hypothetical protein CSA32_03580 [Desulfobulbus propionicus]|nr:MAG: hypothetical protein CSA32_03580 [Desulfobulbus propionicus]
MAELKKIARITREHKELILNYFRVKKEYSSGIVEGVNNKDTHLPFTGSRAKRDLYSDMGERLQKRVDSRSCQPFLNN